MKLYSNHLVKFRTFPLVGHPLGAVMSSGTKRVTFAKGPFGVWMFQTQEQRRKTEHVSLKPHWQTGGNALSCQPQKPLIPQPSKTRKENPQRQGPDRYGTPSFFFLFSVSFCENIISSGWKGIYGVSFLLKQTSATSFSEMQNS